MAVNIKGTWLCKQYKHVAVQYTKDIQTNQDFIYLIIKIFYTRHTLTYNGSKITFIYAKDF